MGSGGCPQRALCGESRVPASSPRVTLDKCLPLLVCASPCPARGGAGRTVPEGWFRAAVLPVLHGQFALTPAPHLSAAGPACPGLQLTHALLRPVNALEPLPCSGALPDIGPLCTRAGATQVPKKHPSPSLCLSMEKQVPASVTSGTLLRVSLSVPWKMSLSLVHTVVGQSIGTRTTGPAPAPAGSVTWANLVPSLRETPGLTEMVA